MDRAVLRWLRRHQIPLDVAWCVAGALACWALSMTVPQYKAFYRTGSAVVPALAAVAAAALGVVAASVSRRSGGIWPMALLARVAVIGAAVLLQVAPAAAGS